MGAKVQKWIDEQPQSDATVVEHATAIVLANPDGGNVWHDTDTTDEAVEPDVWLDEVSSPFRGFDLTFTTIEEKIMQGIDNLVISSQERPPQNFGSQRKSVFDTFKSNPLRYPEE